MNLSHPVSKSSINLLAEAFNVKQFNF